MKFIEDITYCAEKSCANTECMRNLKNYNQEEKRLVSMANFAKDEKGNIKCKQYKREVSK